ncbi:Similar to hypothetical protein TRIATDRAFT_280821 [Trichoderma atroviride IMI 206040]; acc. no. EHK49651 [Pyronema omphalodes CBS 100304]|uniref:Clr5 domain-containing protein n=1 Tax=Pyronema omphalodes (strain CBS 100304) TaxID=1076935 RepID=U4LNB3_PYROM|nr:Similar to hypothetical protein TRIATDRAFT_280821 [Trichoderma atroviride IMI 206040]; acc. no. EHK49651 [Pyronema omphalodes CBS 100304]
MASMRDFKRHRETIKTLYLSENRPLEQLILIMEQRYHFRATEAQYKKRLKEWGMFQKNILKHKLLKLLGMIHKRRTIYNKDSFV